MSRTKTPEKLKQEMMAQLREAEKAAYTYFCALPTGSVDRENAGKIYDNVRHAAQVA